jgi:hypothetical protein
MRGHALVKPNYQFEKRQRELEKKRKQEEKRDLARPAGRRFRIRLTVIAVAATPDDERRSELGSGGERSRNILAA